MRYEPGKVGEFSPFPCPGSKDGSVRVWNLSTREVMMQFAEHHKGVTGLVVDCVDPRLFHSGGLDCVLFTHGAGQDTRATVADFKPLLSRSFSTRFG